MWKLLKFIKNLAKQIITLLLVPHKNLHESAIKMHNVPSLVDKLSKMWVNSYAKLPILLIHLSYVWYLPKIPVSKFKASFCPSNGVSYFTRSAHSTSHHSFVCDVRNNTSNADILPNLTYHKVIKMWVTVLRTL